MGDTCTADDLAQSRTVVYRRDGTPAYAGQALLLTSCGTGTFCHSENSTRRYGAPWDLNFDLQLADNFEDDSEGATRLRRIQRKVHNVRNEIYAAVLDGTMPPGRVGRLVDQHTTNPYSIFQDDEDTEGTVLPSVRTSEGHAILRTWLACGSPVVERTTLATPPACSADSDCTASKACDEFLGECLAVGATIERRPVQLDPIWSDIYPAIIQPSCVAGCHTAGGLNTDLNLSTIDGAREALVGQASDEDNCGTLVVPGEPEQSLLISKLQGTQSEECGKSMPLMGSLLSDTQVALITEWITNGALDD